MSINIVGYFNDKHNNIWAQRVFVKPCQVCINKDKDDGTLEMFLRFNIHHKLQIETDNFDRLFEKYPGIQFNLSYQSHLIKNEKLTGENEIIEYFLKMRLTMGVGFYWPRGLSSYTCTRTQLSIPILKGGKMWQILLHKIINMKDDSPVDKNQWYHFKPEPLSCLFCNDYPRDLYPGNFVVNQNILYLKSIIWVDKRKLHKKKGKNGIKKIILYSESNNIIDWPFLSKYCKATNDSSTINTLGNMAIFTAGKIFISLFDIIISKLIKIQIQNSIIRKFSDYHKNLKLGKKMTFTSLGISIADLIQMHKVCKRKKVYDLQNVPIADYDAAVDDALYFFVNNDKKMKITLREIQSPIQEGEKILIENILANHQHNLLNDETQTEKIIKWFHFPKSQIKEQNVVVDFSQMIKRGEIDVAISQTSILNKEYAVLNNSGNRYYDTDKISWNNVAKKKSNAESNSVNLNNNNKVIESGWNYGGITEEGGGGNGGEIYSLTGSMCNLDVHRIGRFTRNAPTNSYSNICGVACSLQKVLTKDSKTKEPKYITPSEIGYIDLITTSDAPKNCGLILEEVVDTIVSSRSLTAFSEYQMYSLLQKLFPDCEKVENPEKIENLDLEYQYICANRVLYRFYRNIPQNLLPNQISYITTNYGINNYFRVVQYALKIEIPFIELIEQTRDLLWECTSYDGNIYKLHIDGLFYSSSEFIFFHNKARGKALSSAHSHPSLWVGNYGENIPNLYGPSIRISPHPNKCHLPRIGHAAFSSKNFVGTITNSLSIGQLHQKSLTVAFNQSKSYPSEIINIAGCYPKILIASGFNNQEDGIAIRKGAIERGMFSAVSYETAVVKINYYYYYCNNNNNTNIEKEVESVNINDYDKLPTPIEFISTINKGTILRKGMQIGVFRLNKEFSEENVPLKISIEIFSNEFKILETTAEGGEKESKRYYYRTNISEDPHGNIIISDNNNKIDIDWNLSVFWMGKGNIMNVDHPTNDFFYPIISSAKKRAKLRRSLAFQSQNPNYQTYRCEMIRCDNISACQYLKLYLTYASLFTPSIGDKLQTTTANKGVITEIISDENMPYVVVNNELNDNNTNSKVIVPDLIVNPQYLKRQSLDNIFIMGERLQNKIGKEKTEIKNAYMNNCFEFNIDDAIYFLKLGDLYASGRLMNPATGLPYLVPLETTSQSGVDYKFIEYLDENDGFIYTKRREETEKVDVNLSYEMVNATIYTTRYFLVNNHKAAHMMQCSHPDDIIRTEFSGAPVKGKRGGFATGPQEQITLVGLGAERLNSEISQFRSDSLKIPIHSRIINENGDKDQVVIQGSKTLKRVFDEFNQYNIDFSVKVDKCTDMEPLI